MAPSATEEVPQVEGLSLKETSRPAPLELSGALNDFTYDELTPVIGREFNDINIVDDLLNSPDADARLRDLAITSMISFHEQ